MNEKEVTRKAYDDHTKYFVEFFKERSNPEKRYGLRRFVELLPKGARVLDVGCGSGDAALYFKEQGFYVECIDFSERMVEVCKQRGLDARVMDMEDMTFEAECFDGVWASASLLHIPKNNTQKVIDKFYELLKSGGVCYICVKAGEGENIVEEKGMKRFFSYWTEQELREQIKCFQVIEQYKEQHSPKSAWLEVLLKKQGVGK